MWQPPARLAYLWYLGRDRADATEVEIRFLARGTEASADGTVEAWGRSADNPVGSWHGLRSGYRGRFGMYLPPLLEELGLAEVSHDARNNRMRAI